MKLTIVLLLFSNLLLHAAGSSGQSMKETKVSFSVKNMSLKQVFKLIEKQSAFSIGYKNMDINAERNISVSASNKSVYDVLKDLLKNDHADFRQLNDKYILIEAHKKQATAAVLKKTLPAVTLSGIVRDKDNKETIPGASIKLKGSTLTAQTDAKGRFVISIPEVNDATVVLVSYVGYKTQEITLKGVSPENLLTIDLEEDLLGLNEVVVTGQGLSVSKRRLSTNVTTISEKQIRDLPVNRIDQLIQSQIPNAQIKLSGGQAGATSIIQTRGFNSAFANSTPIVYIDGVRVDNLNTAPSIGMNLSGGISQGASTSSLADIPVENIEKIEFISGGAATTLYGSDAANGVLQIFTKKKGSGEAAFSAGVDVGAETPTTDYHYFKRTKELLYQNGLYSKYSLGVNGGDADMGYSAAGAYNKSAGVLIHDQNQQEKLDFRIGLNAKIAKDLTYESSFSYNNQQLKRTRNGNSGGYSGLWFAEDGASKITGPRFNPILDDLTDEEFAKMKSFVDSAEMLQNNSSKVNRFQTAQAFKYQPIKNLLIKGTAGIDYRMQREQSVVTKLFNNLIRSTAAGSLSNFERNYLGLTFDLTAQYEYKVKDFSFLSTFGGQLFRTEDRQISYVGSDIRDGALSIGQAATKTSSEYYIEVANYGLFVQENIGFKDRYFIDLGLRGDGNSAFGKSVGAQYYPKIGFSYILSAEPFFMNLDQQVFSAIKVRANYGVSGNFPTPFANERTIDVTGFNGTQSASFGNNGNDNLRPEKTYSKEVGIDLSLFKDKVSFTAGYFNNTTKGALFIVPPASSTGLGSSLQNIGLIRNKGFEFSTSVSVIENKVWGLRLRASANTIDNMVVSTGGAPAFNLNGLTAPTVQIMVKEGYPIGYISGKYGVFGPDNTLQSSIPLSFLGSTIPTLNGSMGLNLRYKNLSLFANADYQQGGYIHNWDKQFRINYGASTDGVPAEEIAKNKTGNWLNYSQLFVEKSDFIKIRTIGLLYAFDKTRLGRLQNLTIGVTAINPLNFVASSSDPEAVMPGGAQGQGSATTGGLNYAAHSAARQFLASIKINF
ncbi:TonB-dependent receptor plug domain protein [Pedobacter sp. BAL39]|uniref:TonB-dependent receptor domain-containing protein n=1 Tax=Pedobacter sp. BAL39 TaxID=391596 RepID=UPI000155AB54|nr:TonB-dependent receptor [Pedobacter sp. BAL39]EDM34195.1 TonB-dependent receptor plug domain protein [Pedobacter sp. BAL39]